MECIQRWSSMGAALGLLSLPSDLQYRLPGRAGRYGGDVENFQGGEREAILFSATVSEPSVIVARAEFILNVNWANVGFLRAKKRLMVVCSEALLSHIPAEIEHYTASVFWKSLDRSASIVW